MNKYITNNDRRPALPGFYRVIYSNGNTGVEYFDGTTWQVEYSHPVDRWLEESPAQPSILSPEEWLENMGLDFPVTRYGISVIMEKYAGHVAAKVHRETLRLAASQLLEYPFQPEQARKAIRSIPLQDVYPAVEKTTHTDGQ